MAVNISRSMNTDLREGATDGRYRKTRPNTEVANDAGDAATLRTRGHLHPWYNWGYADQEIPPEQRVVPGAF